MAKPEIISFGMLGNWGRFGNCCFEVASTLGMAAKYNAQAVFPNWDYEKYFVNPIPHGEMQPNQIKETGFHYYDWQLTGDCDILGYCQSERYFSHIKDKIKEQFTLKPEVIQSAKDKLPANVFEKETILMQFRRTDYVSCPFYFQLPVTYYIQALLENFPNWRDVNIVCISDDLSYPKIHFECLPNVYFADVIDIEQIAIAGLCDHFIIANSSFGWWAAYLGTKPHSKIIHPGRLHAGKLLERSDEKDYWPERWTNFKKDSYKINLTDTTFTIPVMYDSKDRKYNLDLCVCMLQTNFNTNIIVGEQGGNKFEYHSQWSTYRNFNLQYFHRTKMLNDMAMQSETPYIANWDADVIIAPMQIYLTIQRLREGEDMVFPYDGRFARLPREWFKPIEQLMDIGAIGDTEPKGKRGRPVPESSVGGAVFFNKESFIEGGMENEYMISFGPEDCERNDRFSKLGFKIAALEDRVKGCLYHIDHWCGPDSSKHNPFFAANHLEIEKIRAMSREELRLYVDSFPWRHKYTETYYKRICFESIKSAKEIYKAIGFDKGSVIDIGAGIGEFHNGNPDYVAVDYNIPVRSLLIPHERFINKNLEKEVVQADKKYDLCLCLEVAEHLTESRADTLVEMLCNLSGKVLFSAAIQGQGGTGHYNEQPAHYWAAKFEANGFYPYKTDIRKALFHNSDVGVWYRNNMILYTREKFEIDYELDFVHPQMFESCINNLKNIIKESADDLFDKYIIPSVVTG